MLLQRIPISKPLFPGPILDVKLKACQSNVCHSNYFTTTKICIMVPKPTNLCRQTKINFLYLVLKCSFPYYFPGNFKIQKIANSAQIKKTNLAQDVQIILAKLQSRDGCIVSKLFLPLFLQVTFQFSVLQHKLLSTSCCSICTVIGFLCFLS